MYNTYMHHVPGHMHPPDYMHSQTHLVYYENEYDQQDNPWTNCNCSRHHYRVEQKVHVACLPNQWGEPDDVILKSC